MGTQQTPGIISIIPVIRAMMRVKDKEAGLGREEVFSGTALATRQGRCRAESGSGCRWGRGQRESHSFWQHRRRPGHNIPGCLPHQVEACFKAPGNLKALRPTCPRSAPGRWHLGGLGVRYQPLWGGRSVSTGPGPLGSSAL